MPSLDPGQARLRFAAARVARLATADATGAPHAVPMVFALTGDTIYSAVDAKPKRTTALRRLANVRANPRVAVLADHYDDDWSTLWWVRADGEARVLDQAPEALTVLAAKYEQYRNTPPQGPFLAIEVRHWSGWSAS
ncbi:TIGR03668 family PPOX class F420-dependent oxidoreductase [Virgisporangium aurantiacum]|uniref:PPOX class F420-dependent oxidoreductase n=1 Tax=Virgisporangium aurantiacum TaxID=175570 RepID=A0A8J3Z0X3_9ACTN|nr:TIGR03668 family PPOX class F420-dependent oxidoreductase [Virgisporangium aurantiacum]GIJ55274.1 PPOX class F420-dependent oxidoreductase [Virgisporangium aurantiacum]